MSTLSNFIAYFSLALPEVILMLAILALILIGVLIPIKEKSWISKLSLITLVAVVCALFYTPNLRDITFNGHFFTDSFTFYIKIFITLSTFMVLFNTQTHYTFFKIKHFEFSILLLFCTLGLFILISSNDFLPMYIGLEMQSLSLYILIAMFHGEKNVCEAVIKYFVLGAIASAFILFGITFIYGYTGTTNFFVLEDVLNTSTSINLGLSIGIAFLIAGFAFKIGAVPFHMWTPDVYQGTPYSLLLLLTTAPKIAALGLLMRLLCGPIYSNLIMWQPIVLGLAMASMLFGSIAALLQTDLRRFLAYASISSIGFSLTGLAMANELGLKASLFYTSVYIIAMIGFLTCVIVLLRRGSVIDSLADLRGLAIERPFITIGITAFILTMSGLPPFPGFFGKLFLLQAVISEKFYILSIIMVLTTIIAAYYYLNFLKIMFFDIRPSNQSAHVLSGSLNISYLIVILSIATIGLLIFMPKFLLNWTGIAAATLFYS